MRAAHYDRARCEPAPGLAFSSLPSLILFVLQNDDLLLAACLLAALLPALPSNMGYECDCEARPSARSLLTKWISACNLILRQNE